MTLRIAIGKSERTGTIHVLRRQKRSGEYVLIAPSIPPSEHRFERSYTRTKDYQKALELIENGYHARMANVENSDPADVIKNENIWLTEVDL